MPTVIEKLKIFKDDTAHIFKLCPSENAFQTDTSEGMVPSAEQASISARRWQC